MLVQQGPNTIQVRQLAIENELPLVALESPDVLILQRLLQYCWLARVLAS